MIEETIECCNCYRTATISFIVDEDVVESELNFCPFCGWSENYGNANETISMILVSDE